MASDDALNYSEIFASETEPNSKLFVLFIPSKDKGGARSLLRPRQRDHPGKPSADC